MVFSSEDYRSKGISGNFAQVVGFFSAEPSTTRRADMPVARALGNNGSRGGSSSIHSREIRQPDIIRPDCSRVIHLSRKLPGKVSR
jgi:hypothetical protein